MDFCLLRRFLSFFCLKTSFIKRLEMQTLFSSSSSKIRFLTATTAQRDKMLKIKFSRSLDFVEVFLESGFYHLSLDVVVVAISFQFTISGSAIISFAIEWGEDCLCDLIVLNQLFSSSSLSNNQLNYPQCCIVQNCNLIRMASKIFFCLSTQ